MGTKQPISGQLIIDKYVGGSGGTRSVGYQLAHDPMLLSVPSLTQLEHVHGR